MANPRDRLMRGLLAAYGATILVSFIGGCVYAMMLGRSDAANVQPISPLPLGAILGIGGVAALVTALIAAVAACVIALPLFAILLRHNVSSVAAYVGVGALLGLTVATIFIAAHYFADFLVIPYFGFWLLIVAISGTLAGVMFWIVAVRSKPVP